MIDGRQSRRTGKARRCLGLLLLGTLTLGMSWARADSPAAPFPWVISSKDGEIVFKMVPAKWRVDEHGKVIVERDSFGAAYGLDADGNFVERWRTEGWYTFQAFLSEDGQYLVRMGPWASDRKDFTDLAIAFYDRGKLVKEYQVRDLVKDTSKLEMSVSHYMWSPEKQSEPNGIRGGLFHLVCIDKTAYDFNISTGEIISTEVDEEAQTRTEIYEKEAREAKLKGEKLLNSSSFKKDFEKVFTISQVEAPNSRRGLRRGGILFSEPEWRADLVPRVQLGLPGTVSAIFPIFDKDGLKVTLSREEILEALKKAVSHPFVRDSFTKKDGRELYLRITGDRLHWNASELQHLLTGVRKQAASETELRDWAEITIEFKNGSLPISLFLNVKSGEILYEDHSGSKLEPVLIDSAGTPIPNS
jgi:hypothetical protein